MAYNMIGAGLMGSHSGVTAEGDNSVLMQKVTKDLLAHAQSGKHKMPKIMKQTLGEIAKKDDVSSFNCLKTLIYIREQFELKKFTDKLKDLILDKQEKFYDVWMYKVNDEIQSVALAFGERFFLQNAYVAMEDQCTHSGAKEVLSKVIYLHMISYINENLGWYLRHKFLNPVAASDLQKKQDRAIKDLAPHINTILEGFGLLQA